MTGIPQEVEGHEKRHHPDGHRKQIDENSGTIFWTDSQGQDLLDSHSGGVMGLICNHHYRQQTSSCSILYWGHTFGRPRWFLPRKSHRLADEGTRLNALSSRFWCHSRGLRAAQLYPQRWSTIRGWLWGVGGESSRSTQMARWQESKRAAPDSCRDYYWESQGSHRKQNQE